MKLKKWLLLGIVLIFAIVFVVRFVQVNTKYPAPSYRFVQLGEVEIPESGLEYSVSRAYFASPEEITALYDAIDPDQTMYTRYIPGEQEELLMVELTIHNPTQEEQYFGVPDSLESGAWRNGVDVPMYDYLNPKAFEALGSGETITVKMPFTMSYNQFTPSRWKTVREREYQLMLSLYPEKVVMEIPINHKMGERNDETGF